MLEVRNLRKVYESTVAVDDISFSIPKGKIFGLLGPNGAGKTTTIRMLLNILKPTSGEILRDGKLISSEFYNSTGYLPEERGLYKKSKVIDVITYFAGLKGMSASDAAKRTDYWLSFLDITQYRNRKIEELSKGNQQKIQFIAAIVHDPAILVLDEPFSGFDPVNQQVVKDLILTFANEGKILILSTHQMELAEKLSSSIFLINKGKEIVSGELSEVKRKYGPNSVKLEYTGDGAFLTTHPDVVRADNYQNYSEVQLKSEANPTLFLRSIVDKLEVRHFSVVEPTLHNIFIDLVKSSGDTVNE